MSKSSSNDLVQLSGRKFLAFCAVLATAILLIGHRVHLPSWVVAAEVLITVLGLFVFGSIRYRLDKNALTYGAVLVVGATFFQPWWDQSALKTEWSLNGTSSLISFVHHHLFTLHGLDNLVHADTMLFILGLTFFVAVIAQTRLLETVSFKVLALNNGGVVATVGILTALVSVASGILDGVSMIGLMIRTLVIILLLAKADQRSIIYAVIVSTVVTTVCGMWLAYGEPPNLIMKSNLHPHLDNAFFLRYCLPAAMASYILVFLSLRKKLSGKRIDMKKLDILDLQTADVRFLNASRHGEVPTAIEFLEQHKNQLPHHYDSVIKSLHEGIPLGLAFHQQGVAEPVRRDLLGKFVSEDLAVALDEHYSDVFDGTPDHVKAERTLIAALDHVRSKRVRAQKIGGWAFIPFIGLLIAHAINHDIPLFWASFAGFGVALLGIIGIPKMRQLALKEGRHEYREYLFLLPLFLSITLLQKTGFFSQLTDLLHAGVEKFGAGHVAYMQFGGAVFLSAMLDNNVVADFAGRALLGLDVSLIHLFAMAQIAGYAAGGCWTHIGSAQSVVAYSFIQKEVSDRYTPLEWMKEMTPMIIKLFIVLGTIIYAESMMLSHLH